MSGGDSSLRLGPTLHEAELRAIEKHLHLRYNKWGTQVGDCNVVSPQPLLIKAAEWNYLCRAAEQLAREVTSSELRMLDTPISLTLAGVPKVLREVLTRECWNGARCMRFDFHPTELGWRVSEVNSDVPGGWNEGTALQELYCPHFPEFESPTSPLQAWGEMVYPLTKGGTVVLLAAPGFLEDEQVIRAFARQLQGRGADVTLIGSPRALSWNSTHGCKLQSTSRSVSVVVRFYQLEWLSSLPEKREWKSLLGTCEIPVINPAISAISESKRFALAVQGFSGCPAWEEFWPECRDPRDVDSRDWDEWVLKASYSNTGEDVHICADLDVKSRRHLIREAQRKPSRWVAQRRFDTIALESSRGRVFPCIGIFVVNGQASGAYVRLSPHQVTDSFSLEAPLFLERTSE